MTMAKFVTYLQKCYENNHGVSKTLHIIKQNNLCSYTHHSTAHGACGMSRLMPCIEGLTMLNHSFSLMCIH